MAAAALLATYAIGSGFIVANDFAELQLDPIGFLRRLGQGWVPNSYLGYHSGFVHPFATPYGWFAALLEALHVPGAARQRVLDGVVFFAIAAGAYWGIGRIAPATTREARLCGALAYLFAPYVAFNVGNGTTNMLGPYAALPFLTGLAASALRGRMTPLRAGIWTGIAVFCGGGINVPLEAMNAIVVLVYVCVASWAVAFAGAARRRAFLRRLVYYGGVGLGAALVLNLYWIAPFLDYTHTFWLGGLLDESPKQHSAESSYANVLRGLGQWAIFRGDATGPWYPWAATYLQPFFSWTLWFGPLLATLGLLLRRRFGVGVTFFTVLAVLSVPLAVGYYHGAAGAALTAPLYDFLYTKVPGFTMFRSAYKWVWPYEFASAGLVALAVSALQVRALVLLRHSRPARFAVAGFTAVVFLAAFGPIVANKMYHPSPPLPSWTRDEARFVGHDPARLALFPGQYLEWYDWIDRAFYLETQNVEKPIVSGYITGAPSEATHVILTRAYKLARAGDRRAADIFRALSVDEVLQRDDFRSLMDFAFVGNWVPTDSSLAHDMLVRVLGARPRAQDGANRLYALDGALPLVSGTANARFDGRPALSVAASGDYGASARGVPVVSADGMDAATLAATTRAAVASGDAATVADTAATLPARGEIDAECFDARCSVRVATRGRYRLSIAGLAAYPSDFREAFDLPGYDFTRAGGVSAPLFVRLDQRVRSAAPSIARTWRDFGAFTLAAGPHALAVPGASPTTPVMVKFTPEATFAANVALARATLASADDPMDVETPVDARVAVIDVPVDGRYVLAASPRHVVRTAPARSPAIPATRWRPEPGFGVTAWAPGGATVELPYVPGAGMLSLNAALMPSAWYLDPTLYAWNRGSAVPWYLLRPRSNLRVIVPFARGVHATLTLRLAGVTHAIRTFDVFVDGRRSGRFRIGGGVGPLAADFGRVPLGTEPPVVAKLPLALGPGEHLVTLATRAIAAWSAHDVDPSSASFSPVIAALGSDVAFEATLPAGVSAAGSTQPASRVIDRDIVGMVLPRSRAPGRVPFAVFRLPLDNDRLDGVPSILTTAATFPNLGVEWLAAAIADDPARRHVRFRIVQNIGALGEMALTPSTLLPNSSSDEQRRIVGAWVVLGADPDGRTPPGLLQFALRDLHVERALPAPLPDTRIGSLPLSVDGHAAATPLFLTRGRHRVTARTRTDIGTLRVRSTDAPSPRDIPLQVARPSAVALDVATAGPTPPFVLVLNESFHPEWQATANGSILPHVHANGFANGWIVPASTQAQTIRLRFTAQRTYVATAWLSVLGGLLCLGGLLWPRP